MWPGFKGQGTRISYGNDGGGLFLPNMQADEPWRFARTHENGIRLYDVSCKLLIPPIETVNDVNKTRNFRELQKLGKDIKGSFVPTGLISDYSQESTSFVSPLRYDPTVGKLMDVGYIWKRYTRPAVVKCILYTDAGTGGKDGGNSGNCVKLSLLDHKLNLSVTATCNVRGRVMQVEIFKGDEDDEDEEIGYQYVLVRTSMGTFLLKYSTLATKKIWFEPDETIEIDTRYHVHATFNPYNKREIATINHDGEWSIFRILYKGKVSKVEKDRNNYAGTNQYKTSSRWNKILWGGNGDELIIANRIHAKYYNRRTQRYTMLVLGDQQEKLRDIVRSPLNKTEHFILTSHRLIWTDSKTAGNVMLKWDHSLSRDDVSMQLSACKLDDIAMITIFSQVSHANIVFQFKFMDGMPISADDPYYYLDSPELITQSLSLIAQEKQETDKVCSFRFSTDFGLVKQVLSTDQSKVYNEIDQIQRVAANSNNDKKPKLKYNFTRLYNRLFPELPQIDAAPAGDIKLKTFAKNLADRITKLHTNSEHGVYTLNELETTDVLFEDIKELDSMLQQLQNHFGKSTISVSHVGDSMNLLFPSKVQSVDDIYEYIMDLWVTSLPNGHVPDVVTFRRQKISWFIASELGLSLLTAKGNKDSSASILEQVSHSQESLSNTQLKPTTKQLLSEWEGNVEDYQWFRFDLSNEEKQTQLTQLTQQTVSLRADMPPSPPSQVPLSLVSQPSMSQATPKSKNKNKSKNKRRKTGKKEGFV